MKFLSNHSFLSYFWALGLALVLGMSPMQNVNASFSAKNMGMENGMQHKMSNSSHHAQMNKNNSDENCCETAQCNSAHCTGTISAVITSSSIADFTYSVSSTYKAPHFLLSHYYSSSLFRPPKI